MSSIINTFVLLLSIGLASLCSGYTISNISLGTLFGDLTGITEFTNGSAAIDLFLLQGNQIAIFWDYTPNNNEPALNITTTLISTSSVELIAGTVAAAGDEVVDIPGINVLSGGGLGYLTPTTLPTGDYHFRINSSINVTTDFDQLNQPPISQQLTARGGDLSISMSLPVGCGAGLSPKPGNFTKVPSPSSPEYHSLYFLSPYGGLNIQQSSIPGDNSDSDGALIPIEFQYRDENNAQKIATGNGISNITVQFLNAKDSSTVGLPHRFDTTFTTKAMGLQVGQAYKVQVGYTNAIQDGPVAPGGRITVTSDEFNVIDPQKTNCTLLAIKGLSSSRVTIKMEGSIKLLFSVFLLSAAFLQ